jgi:hypothetical protein
MQQPPLANIGLAGSLPSSIPIPHLVGALMQPKKRSLRLVAFASVAFATVSVMACVITLPMVYHHVQAVQSFMAAEVDFCKTRSRDMWREMVQIQAATGIPIMADVNDAGVGRGNRTGRQAAVGYGATEQTSSGSAGAPPGTAGNPQGGSCCSCQVGPPGPPGPPGRDGRPG